MRNLERPAYLLVLASFLALTSACGDDTETGGGGQGPAGGGGSGEGGATGGGGEGQGGTPDIPLDSKVISTSNNTFYEAETSVVATSTGRVVAAWIGATFSGHTVIGYATSEDDGATFSAPQFVENTTGIEQGDPVLAELPGGTVILTWLGYDYDNTGNTTNMHTFTALLEDGSPSFDNVVIASDPLDDPYLLDKPWIAVTDDGSIVLTYAHINQQGDSTLVSSFSDDGLTWSQANVFPESANHFYNLAYVCSAVGAGRMHAAVLDFSNFGVKLVAVHSDDGGATWSEPVDIAGTDANVNYDDPVCVASGDTLTVLYGTIDGPAGGEDEASLALAVAQSTNGGKTFGAPVPVGSATLGPLYLHPAIATAPDGHFAISYYEGATDPDDQGTYVLADDEAIADLAASTAPIGDLVHFTASREDAQWVGDYVGLAFGHDGTLHTTYVANLPDSSHIAYAKKP